jgi:hypothetical protein
MLFFLAPRLTSQGDKPATHLPVNVILSKTYLIETGSKGNLLISFPAFRTSERDLLGL